jgi:hypothetical protein
MNWQQIATEILGLAPDILALIEAIENIVDPKQQAAVSKAVGQHLAALKKA